MPTQYYFMTSLPTLGSLGEQPAISLGDFLQRCDDIPEVSRVCKVVLLEHDLFMRQAALAGEIEDVQPILLTPAQARGEQPLEGILEIEETSESSRGVGEDNLWRSYYRYVDQQAKSLGCGFLSRWVGYEVALRNTLVDLRARNLDLNPDEYYVTPELADSSSDTESAVAAWAAAEDPMAALKALDSARWQWLEENGKWFSFEVDEAAAYARALVLLTRWYEVTRETDTH